MVSRDGTPPRVWGKRNFPHRRIHYCRYTPTCVGKTLTRVVPADRTTVHPHVCGENGLIFVRFVEKEGTPPRVWGKLHLRSQGVHGVRYTPTCVGKTIRHNLGIGNTSGTPPRVWGKLVAVSECEYVIRYTPTCVGKTTLG